VRLLAGAPDAAVLTASHGGAALRAEALPLGWRLLAGAPDAAVLTASLCGAAGGLGHHR
jgi:hypothetical protein